MSPYDLHTHSTHSDGMLTPAELLNRAARNGVQTLALTDHDDVSGLSDGAIAAQACGIEFVNGVEISVLWREQALHIVGLGIDPAHDELQSGLASIRLGRIARAQKMAHALDKLGVTGSLEGALEFARNPNTIGRAHFARFLIQRHIVKDMKSAFKRLLGAGRPAYVAEQWPELKTAISWINNSGGVAVIAHPGSYGLSSDRMRALLTDFCSYGGRAIEVMSGIHDARQCNVFAAHARYFGLASSAGSDFHSPQESRCDIGGMPELPAGCVPVWHELQAA